MSGIFLPTCYFPSTVLFVDDSRDFLMNFMLQLDDHIATRVFDTPIAALDAVNATTCRAEQLNQRCFSEYVESHNWPMTNQTINIDLDVIHWEVFNAKRFNEISVVVVDYSMPEMDGITFCQQLADSPVKKILLTGEADEKIAIDAFNEGIIHRYIKKSDPNVARVINESIHKLQRAYFHNMSDMIVKMLAVNSPNCLQDRRFADFFRDICEEHRIVEFYLTENSGSFLMLDEYAKKYMLILKTEQDLTLYYDLARDNNASEDVLDKLARGECIPYNWQAEQDVVSRSDWSSCLYPISKVECNETYYYALIQEPAGFNPEGRSILSYHEFLERPDENPSEVEQAMLLVD